jgi:hypothetical protein
MLVEKEEARAGSAQCPTYRAELDAKGSREPTTASRSYFVGLIIHCPLGRCQDLVYQLSSLGGRDKGELGLSAEMVR